MSVPNTKLLTDIEAMTKELKAWLDNPGPFYYIEENDPDPVVYPAQRYIKKDPYKQSDIEDMIRQRFTDLYGHSSLDYQKLVRAKQAIEAEIQLPKKIEEMAEMTKHCLDIPGRPDHDDPAANFAEGYTRNGLYEKADIERRVKQRFKDMYGQTPADYLRLILAKS